MKILGISAFHRDAAAALVVDGELIAAAQEERYTRKRADSAFPKRAARFCLDRAGLASGELDAVVFYEKPLRKFERTLATQLQAFPRSAKSFSRGMFLWLGDRLWLKTRIAEDLAVEPTKVKFVEHQRAHAAGAFFASPFEEAAVLTLDDLGEWATAVLAHGRGNKLEVLSEAHFPHSLGLWLSAFVQFLGFEPGADEEKLEALAHFGAPRFAEELASTLREEEGGGFSVDMRYFRFNYDGERLFESSLAEMLGPARMPGSPVRYQNGDTRDADIAASVQRVLEERVLAMARALHARTKCAELCVAGEVLRNRTLLARLVEDGPFARVYAPPSVGEAGAAIGAALEYQCSVAGGPRGFVQQHARLGERIEDRAEEGARALANVAAARALLVERLSAGKIAGWARGEMELGGKSLGSRVILADPRPAEAREKLLAAVQQHEAFVPCRIAVRAERARELFELPEGCEHALRFGHLLVRARDATRAKLGAALLPDGAAWVQVVDSASDEAFSTLLADFERATGAPALLVTNLNLRGVPIARSEADCVEVFRRSSIDLLVVETRVYERASN